MFRRRRKNDDEAAAIAEPTPDSAELLAEIDRLGEQNRASRSVEIETRIRRLRHEAGVALVKQATSAGDFVAAAASSPPRGGQSGVPEIEASELSPAVLRAAILDGGCLLVRNLIEREKATAMAQDIERSVLARQALREGVVDPEGLYDELETHAEYPIAVRDWIEEGGGVLAVDSPRLLFEMLEAFSELGLRGLIEEYLGEPAAISAQKCTLRKATPDVGGAWHQDGSFMGDVRSLNVWVALSRCGDVAPSMDLVPRRLDGFVETGGEGTFIPNQISPQTAERAAGEFGVVRPIFDPGDALLFDEVFLHQTGSDPAMPNPRYAIESWFFGVSSYPGDYAPIAL